MFIMAVQHKERELKFRAWDTKQDFYHMEMTLRQIMDLCSAGPEKLKGMGMKFRATSHDLLFEQFIGIKDKSNREIYENDIIGMDLKDGTVIPAWIVKIKDGTARLLGSNGSFGNPIVSKAFWKTHLVIGTTRQNPEMIASFRSTKKKVFSMASGATDSSELINKN